MPLIYKHSLTGTTAEVGADSEFLNNPANTVASLNEAGNPTQPPIGAQRSYGMRAVHNIYAPNDIFLRGSASLGLHEDDITEFTLTGSSVGNGVQISSDSSILIESHMFMSFDIRCADPVVGGSIRVEMRRVQNGDSTETTYVIPVSQSDTRFALYRLGFTGNEAVKATFYSDGTDNIYGNKITISNVQIEDTSKNLLPMVPSEYVGNQDIVLLNSDFSTLGSWGPSDVAGVVTDIVSGQLRVQTFTGTRGGFSTFTTEVGKTYKVIGTSYEGITDRRIRVGDGTVADAGLADSQSTVTGSTHVVEFTAISTTSYIYLRSLTVDTVYWDNVVIVELDESQPVRGYKLFDTYNGNTYGVDNIMTTTEGAAIPAENLLGTFGVQPITIPINLESL